jgi:hypothetical protein
MTVRASRPATPSQLVCTHASPTFATAWLE